MSPNFGHVESLFSLLNFILNLFCSRSINDLYIISTICYIFADYLVIVCQLSVTCLPNIIKVINNFLQRISWLSLGNQIYESGVEPWIESIPISRTIISIFTLEITNATRLYPDVHSMRSSVGRYTEHSSDVA